MQFRPNPADPDTEGKLIGMGWIFLWRSEFCCPATQHGPAPNWPDFWLLSVIITGGLSQITWKTDRNGTQIAESALVGGYSDL
jgi:hypothetical protein